MSTSLVLGNGATLVNIDSELNVKDFYWPFVGEANHLAKRSNQIFLFIDGKIVYLDQDHFEFNINYSPNSLVAVSTARSELYQLEISFEDFVVHDQDIFIRRVGITNLRDFHREFPIFFKHNFDIREDDVGNTATWYPAASAMCHYRKNSYLAAGFVSGIHEYTCAAPNDNDGKGAFPDNEGRLRYNPVSTGKAESCISHIVSLDANGKSSFDYFIVCGHNYQEITELAKYVRKQDLTELFKKTDFYWQNWLKPKTNFQKLNDNSLEERLATGYARSLMIIRTQTDNNGAIVAANDSEFTKKGGTDSYSYMWPRDGANTAIAYIEAGYPDLARNFFNFCKNAITAEGFLHHKYYSDLSKGIGSSWHPWIDKYGNEQLPIQEDETASVLIALNQYYKHTEDIGFINEIWNPFIVPALNFLIDYRFTGSLLEDNNPIGFKFAGSHLPKPSYDLWEIHWGIHSYTVASVYAALVAGARLAEIKQVEHLVDSCVKAAEEIKSAYEDFFYDEKEGIFINSYFCDSYHTRCRKDFTLDASISTLWSLGMFDIKDDRITRTMERVEAGLWLTTEVGGFARKQDDNYLRVDPNLPGNPWFISTLWMAQYHLQLNDTAAAAKYICWVLDHTDHTGLMAEQTHPYTGYGLSVKPLTWSHAEFIRTLTML